MIRNYKFYVDLTSFVLPSAYCYLTWWLL